MESSFKIAVTSGKGGTGKTTVSTGLFHVLKKQMNYNVQLVDCDVEEPNCHIFIKADKAKSCPVTIPVPEIINDKCNFCGKCKSACAYNAIVMLPTAKFIEVNESLCRGCGACLYVCPEDAIIEHDMKIGEISHFSYFTENDFIEGRLKIGKALQTPLIKETIKQTNNKNLVLLDSPPGTSCPVVATVSKADYVILVTEPTPFGLHDLKLMVDTVKQIDKKHAIVINKAGYNYKPLYSYIKQEAIPIIGEIPFKKELAREYSKGKIITKNNKEIQQIFINIIKNILNEKAL